MNIWLDNEHIDVFNTALQIKDHNKQEIKKHAISSYSAESY